MKNVILLAIIVVVAGCTAVDEPIITNQAPGIQELLLSPAEINQLGMTSNQDQCLIEEYETGEGSPLGLYSFCNYTIESIDTELLMEFRRFSNLDDRDGSYQYSSSHLRSADGLLGEDEYGDYSRFYVNNENDYGAEFNPPGIYFYSLWIAKDEYLIHITTKGSEEARAQVATIGEMMMSRFD